MRLRILLLGLLHLILLLLWPYLSLQAQTPLSVDPYTFKGILDTTRVRVVYQLTYIIDVDKPQQKKTQELELLLGKRYELFRFDKEGFDKGFSVPNGSELNIPGYGLAASVFLFDRYSGQRQTFIKGVAPSTLSYTTEDTSLQWSLRPETKEILGHTCQKATVQYLGRSYTAWFATSLPISSGPWKLRGLPGLILEVSDERGEYQFDAVLIEEEPKNATLILSISDRYIVTTRRKVNEALRRIHKDILQAIQTIYGRRPQVIGSDAVTISVPYNPIELE